MTNQYLNNKGFFITLFLFLPLFLLSQISSDDLNLNNLIEPLEEEGINRDAEYFKWGGSIIKDENGLYHLFYSRWKREHTFSGWLTFSEIAHSTSESPTGPWEFVETALKGRGKGHWDEITAHNPKIKQFEGKYYLYYIATNFGGKDFNNEILIGTHGKSLKDQNRRTLRENQRTGVAVSNSLYGPWERMNQPLIEPSGPIVTLTVNPAIEVGDDGKYYLIIKGDKPNEERFIRNQVVAISDSPKGPFEIHSNPVIGNLDTEDVSMWYDKKRERFYAVFHAHTYIGLITSRDGVNWEKANHNNVTNKKILKSSNSFLIPDRMERPYVFVEHGFPKVLCLAIKKANDSFTIFINLRK